MKQTLLALWSLIVLSLPTAAAAQDLAAEFRLDHDQLDTGANQRHF
jgi:hypothetical protein